MGKEKQKRACKVKKSDKMIRSLVKEYETKCDFIDTRIYEIKKEVISIENNVTSNIYLDSKSFGVRVLVNGGWGMAYSNDFGNAREVFEKALKMAKLSAGEKKEFKGAPPVTDSREYAYITDPFLITPSEKLEMLKDYEKELKKEKLIRNSRLILECSRVRKSVIAPGVDVNQEFTNNLFRAFVTAREGNVIQSVSKHYSRLGGYEVLDDLSPNSVAEELIGRVKRLLHARAPKAERSAVVCDPMMTGLFFHEAVGHACEADSILNNASVFKGMLNKKVASDEVNLVDDPTIKERGFYWYDDEGIRASPTPLITNGILTGFMHSLRTANEMGELPTGNGRVMNADYPPIPRMSNTVLKPGKWKVDDLIKEVRNGYLVKGFSGGVVDPITGQFSFGASECFRIRNGEVGEPLRDVTLAGNILEALRGIKVADDATKTHLTGTCGKDGQGVRVGDYCPSILVREVIVGGRS